MWSFVHWTEIKSLPCHLLSRLDIAHIITSVYLLYHLEIPVWAEGYQRASADLGLFLPIIVLNVFYKVYLKFTIYFINYAIAKSIVWQLEAWETISGEQQRRFQRPNDWSSKGKRCRILYKQRR